MKITFLGVGGIAGNYLHSLKRLERTVSAVCDINAERASVVAAEHGGVGYADYEEMLRRERPDAVFVCVPPAAHDNQVALAADYGAAVFVAKPVALDLDVALRTRDAISKAGVINQAGYMARYSDITEEALNLIGDRRAGLGSGRFMCRMGANHPWWGKFSVSGGQLVEQSTHVFDWFRLFMGEVEEVHAYGHKGYGEDIANFEDSTVVNLIFKRGTVANIASTCATPVPEGFATEIMGRDWYLRAAHDFHLTGQIDGEDIDFTGEEAGYFRQIDEFLKAVENNDQSLVRSTYEDATKTLAVTIAANESLGTGKPVKVSPV